MIFNTILLVFINFLIFFFILNLLNFCLKKFSISEKNLLLGLVSSVIVIFILKNYYNHFYSKELYTLSLFIFFPLLLLLNIYFPLLVDRSFSIAILFNIKKKTISPKKISSIYKKKFNFFINRRINDLISLNFIVYNDRVLKLTKKGDLTVKIMGFIKRLYKI